MMFLINYSAITEVTNYFLILFFLNLMVLNEIRQKEFNIKDMREINIINKDSEIIIKGQDFEYIFNLNLGDFTSLKYNGLPLITDTPKFNLWRGPTDNDRQVKHKWFGEGYNRLNPHIYSVEILKEDKKQLSIQVEFSLGGFIRKPILQGKCIWNIYGSGDIILDSDFKVRENLPFLPRLGLQLSMPVGNEKVEYFGYGPHESYIDKHWSTRKSRFTSTVDKMHENYLRPQENGSHYDSEWAKVSNSQGVGLMFIGMEKFSFNASHFTPHDLTNARHPHELKRRGETVVNLDYGISGMGSNSCGPELLEKYQLSEREISFKLRIKPVVCDDGDVMDIVNSEIRE